MKVLLLHKALVNGAYQKKAEALAAIPGIDLTVIVPPSWREVRAAVQPLERRHTQGYELIVAPIWFNGHHHIHCYPTLGRIVRRVRPDVFHVDEEPFNLATAAGVPGGRASRRAVALRHLGDGLPRQYPPPFSLFERYTHRRAAAAVAGNDDALEILRRRGYCGLADIVPLAIDPDLYPPRAKVGRDAIFTIGFLGRLVREKGAHILLDAAARARRLAGAVRRWRRGGSRLRTRAERLGIGGESSSSRVSPRRRCRSGRSGWTRWPCRR